MKKVERQEWIEFMQKCSSEGGLMGGAFGYFGEEPPDEVLQDVALRQRWLSAYNAVKFLEEYLEKVRHRHGITEEEVEV